MVTQEMILMLFLHLPHMWAGLVLGRTVKMPFPTSSSAGFGLVCCRSLAVEGSVQ